MVEEFTHVPDNDFVEELYNRKKGNEFQHHLSQGSRELLHSRYFPYNTKISRALLKDKHLMFIGDSLIRAMYKDMISLIQTGDLCTPHELRVSNEDTIFGDKHIDMLELDANRVFRQAREFQSNRHLVQYFFTNRAMRDDLEKTCLMIEATGERPDIVVINSAIWDVSRYPSTLYRRPSEVNELLEEINVTEEYLNRVAMLCRRLRVLLPPSSTVVWVLMPPSSSPDNDAKNKGFLGDNHLFFDAIRMRLLEANVRVAQIVREAGFDVLDLAFHMRNSSFQVFRIKDGVHWNVVATRFMNQLLLDHLSTAWHIGAKVFKKWCPSIVQRTNRENRSCFFEEALNFLRELNSMKHINEDIHQKVRVTALHNYDSENRHASMEQFIQWTRTLLMIDKFYSITENESRSLEMAWSCMPTELSMFSQEDLQRIGKLMDELKRRYKKKKQMPGLFMALSHKRHRAVLLDSPENEAPASVSRITPAECPTKKVRYE